MKPVAATIRVLDGFAEWTGRTVAWLTYVMVIVTCAVVLMRYGFNRGSIALQESVTYLHATVFMLGAAYTLRHDGHVRVDILYQRFSERGRAIVDLLGALLLLEPVALFIVLSSIGYVSAAWRIGEASPEPEGLPFVFVLKTLIPAMGGLLGLQGFANALRAAARLAGQR